MPPHDDVVAALNYLAPIGEPLRTWSFDPPGGGPRFNGSLAPHTVTLVDARVRRGALSLAANGFVLVDHTSAVRDWWNEHELRTVHYPEAEALARRLTGARRAVVFDHTLRRRAPGRPPLDGTGGSFAAVREPVGRVHVDYTPVSGPDRARQALGPTSGRFAILGLWRPIIATPLLDAPLALADARSLRREHLVRNELIYPRRRGETYAVVHDPSHRWYHVSAQRRDEVIGFMHFDSAADPLGNARAAAHTAFEHPRTPPGAPPRESLELRVALAFDG